MNSDQRLILGAGLVRSAGIGLLSVLLGLYLSKGGLDAGQIGLVVAAGLLGVAGGTFLVSFWADRIGRRRTLILLALLTASGGIGLALLPSFPLLILTSFVGLVNGMGRERGPLYTLEQAVLPETTDAQHRTQMLAWYNLVLDVGLGLGSLAAGLPFFLRQRFGLGELVSYRWALVLYVLLTAASMLFYLPLSRRVEIRGPTPPPLGDSPLDKESRGGLPTKGRQVPASGGVPPRGGGATPRHKAGGQAWHRVSPASRRVITKLSLLFGLDSFAGGFLPASLIAYWFFRRFGVGEEMLAPVFFVAHVVNAVSYLAAAWLARRIGLVNTMVFTHVPASLCLILIPFAPALWAAVSLYLVREFLVEMDVPTRQSYVLALVEPAERTLASGVTNLTRVAAWSVGPGLAGYAMKSVSLSTPLFVGGGLKLVYDALLYSAFRRVKPPEER